MKFRGWCSFIALQMLILRGGHYKIKYIDIEEHAVSRMELPSPVVMGKGWGVILMNLN